MLVGRARELEALRAAATRAAQGTGAVVAVVGPPGIGKTRLADEIAVQAPSLGLSAHWGRGAETGGAPAYWPWSEILASVARRVPGVDLPAALTPIVSREQGMALGEARRTDPAEGRFALFEATAAFLRDVGARGPLLLVFDDLHVADVPTLELVGFVARSVRSSRVLIVATWRDAEGRQHPVADALARLAREAVVLRPAPLDGSEVAALLLSSAVRDAGDPHLAATLHQRTQGNPLFVHEALRLVQSGTALSELHAALGVEAVIRQRVGRLDPLVAALLPAAAVLGREVPTALLAAVVDLPEAEVERRALGLLAAGLVARAPGGWTFDHVLVREALYEALAPDERRALHARAARAVERRVEGGDEALLPLCLHHALGGLPDVDPAWVVGLALRTAARARSQGAWEDAAAWLERARAAVGPTIDASLRAEVELALGWAALDAGRGDTAADAFRAATRLARGLGDARLLARAALGHGAEFVLGNVRDDLVALLEEALGALDPGETILRARLLARLAAAFVPGPRTPEALGIAREAFRTVAGHSDDRVVLEVAVAAGSALGEFVRSDEGVALTEEMVRRARRTGDRVLELRGLSRRVTEHLALGEVAAADAVLAMRDDLAAALRLPRYQWQAPVFRGMRAMIEGRFDVCDAAWEEARALCAKAGDTNASRCAAIHRTWVLLLADRVAELSAHEALVLRAVDPMTNGALFRQVIPGLVHARRGEAEAARRLLVPIAPHVFPQSGYMLAVSVADALVDLGERDLVPLFLDQLRPAAHLVAVWGPFGLSCGLPIALVLARLEALGGSPDAADRLFRAALDQAQAMGARALEAWVRYAWARDRHAAMLPEARAIAVERGMDGLVARIDALEPVAAPPLAFSLKRVDGAVVIERAGRTIRLRPLKGLDMIARLVATPGRAVPAVDLARGGAAPEADDRGDAGEMLDAKARLAYKARLLDLREELNEAQAVGHVERAERIHGEMQALARELSRAVGLGGRVRRSGAVDERARVSVAHRIREAVQRIAEHDPELGRHLDQAVRTGASCVYDPHRVGRRAS